MDAAGADLADGGVRDAEDVVPAGRRFRWGPLLWLATGILCGTVFFLAASVGLVIIPVVVPLAVLLFTLFDAGTEGRAAGLLGLFIATDLFLLSLILAPPCVAPFLREGPDGTFTSGCDATQGVAGLALAAGLGNVLVILLAWVMVKKRRMDAAASAEGAVSEAHT